MNILRGSHTTTRQKFLHYSDIYQFELHTYGSYFQNLKSIAKSIEYLKQHTVWSVWYFSVVCMFSSMYKLNFDKKNSYIRRKPVPFCDLIHVEYSESEVYTECTVCTYSNIYFFAVPFYRSWTVVILFLYFKFLMSFTTNVYQKCIYKIFMCLK